MFKRIRWYLFAILCILVGLYPYMYFIIERTFGLLDSKSAELLQDTTWNIMFYSHILLGGFALMIGWAQFSKKFRTKHIKWHRRIGKAYIIAALISGISSLYIAHFATGGIISMIGFLSLGVIWLFTTIMAYKAIKNGEIVKHQKFMIFSYAACFAAVTLRIWLPILTATFQDFIFAYRIVAWLCWVPNIIVAFFLTRRLTA
ncbi:MAG: DUF2306 domain-containing protein [Bacteroidia bacterium]|nr:DUF2306 domain-containing protein [Bacteroidia bacterium]